MKPALRKYIVSERFIHDGLVSEAKQLLKSAYGIWREKRSVSPSLILWLDREVKADDGGTVKGLVTAELPADLGSHRDLIKKAILKVHAYAFFYIRREGSEIKALFESPHGTASWVAPIIRSADVELLKAATMREDKDSLSLLWSPKQGTS